MKSRIVGKAIGVGVPGVGEALAAPQPVTKKIKTTKIDLGNHLILVFDIPINDAYTR